MHLILMLISASTLWAAQGKVTTKATAATTTSAAAYRFLPTIGPSFFSIAGKEVQDLGTRTGLFAAALFDYRMPRIAPGTYLQVGPGFLQTGAELTVPAPNGTGQITLSYLTLPAFLKYEVTHTPANRIHVRGGLIPALLVNQRVQASNLNNSFDSQDRASWKEFDLMASAGVGFTTRFAPGYDAQFDAAYVVGTMDVTRNPKDTNDPFGSTLFHSNQGFVVSGGMFF